MRPKQYVPYAAMGAGAREAHDLLVDQALDELMRICKRYPTIPELSGAIVHLAVELIEKRSVARAAATK